MIAARDPLTSRPSSALDCAATSLFSAPPVAAAPARSCPAATPAATHHTTTWVMRRIFR